MGFGKIKKEVEASGLDPQVAHADLTVDGHLVSPPAHTTVSAYYEPEKLKEILATYPQDESGVPEIVYEQFVEADSVEEFTTKVTEAATEESVAKTKENEEDIAYVQKLLFDNLKQVEETEDVARQTELVKKLIAEAPEAVEESNKIREKVLEQLKTDSKVKEKKAPTKKKPTKK